MRRWKIVTTKFRQKYVYSNGIEYKPYLMFNVYRRWFIFWIHFHTCESLEEAEKLIEYEEKERKNKIANKYF